MTIKKVALIGAGNMGSRMAKNVHKAGFDLMVCDQSQAVLDEFASMGVKVTKLTPQQEKVWQEAMAPVWKQVEAEIGREIIDDLLKAREAR